MRRRTFVSLLAGAAAGPAYAALPEACGVPVRRDDGWPVASINDDTGVDRVALCAMADRLAATSAGMVHSVLVARGGRLAFERYFSGPDENANRRVPHVDFDVDTLHDIKSVTKSVASLAFGIAIDRGLIRGVDEPIFNFFPELSDLKTPDKAGLTLAHALTMSVGLQWVEATPERNYDNDEVRMQFSPDPVRYVLGLPVTTPPGQTFFYNTGTLQLLSAIVRKATGRPLDEFAREALFAPLGIGPFEWKRVRGDSDAGGGLRLRPRDMAKIGELTRAGGSWNGRQIVPKAWIETSTSAKLKADDDQSYGYLWWLGRAAHNGRVIPWIGALGRGGQYIRIVPDLDLVVAVTEGYYQDYSRQAFQAQYGIFKDVLRAVA